MKKLSIAFLLTFSIAGPLIAGSGGLYYGGSLGQSFIKTQISDIDQNDFKLDGNDFAFKFLVGVRMGSALAIEGGYRNLGSVKSKVSEVTFLSKTSGYDLSAVGNIYLGIVDLFAKGGAFWWDQEVQDWKGSDTIGGTNFFWGFGATLRLGGMGIRAEWERYELPNFDQLASLSLGLVFGL